jgi:capsular exopolysaccharide synthesis family protein
VESVDYIKILKNHWKVVVALVLLAIVAVFLTSPKTPTKAYSAEHLLMLNNAAGNQEGATGFNNLALAAMMATNDTEDGVPARVAATIGYQGKPSDLAAKISATGDTSGLPLLHVTATAGTPDEAIKLSNAFGTELVKFINEREAADAQKAQTEAATTAARIEGEIRALNDRIAGNPPDKAQLEAQVDAKTRELGLAMGNEEAAGTAAEYTSIREATSASTDAGFVAGASRAQRSLFAGVVAALLGFGVAIMLDRSDSRLRTKEAAERHFGLPVLAEIPLLGIGDRSRAAVIAFERVPRVAEAYRSLRTALLLFRGKVESDRMATNGNGHANGSSRPSDPSRLRQLVVVTSPEPGDGKSTTTANLAMAYAETGQSVLLVSWDLWRPLSPGVFDAEEGPGVSDYLDGHGSSLVRYVQDTSIPGVRIVTAGLGGHHPTAQIEAARRLLEEARTLANVVIVDTAPILSASVTRELVTLADAVVVVCRSGRTTASAADRCAELLERLGAPTLGVVLVGVPTGPFADYYGAPPKGIKGRLDRSNRPNKQGARRSDDETGPRHKAPTSRPTATSPSSRPTAAQYRATTSRGPDGGRESIR